MLRRAALSRCARYRYALWREWEHGAGTVLFIGLNPSTADHRRDDPTIRRCIGFARAWGFQRLAVANLFAYRTPHPAILRQAAAPLGPRNDRWLSKLAGEAQLVIAAWGAGGCFRARDADVLERLGPMHCLGLTRDGRPRHPLYVRAATAPVPFARL